MPMLASYPAEINLDRSKLARAIDTLIACSQACTACADACPREADVAVLVKGIRTAHMTAAVPGNREPP
jgi:heterodisulfide reductase subunit C